MASTQYRTLPFFLFDTLWPFAKWYQFGGHFPCYKVEQNGRIFLKPMGTATIIKRYSLFIVSWLVFIALSYMSMWLTWNGLTYSDYFQVFVEKHGQSKMDFAAFYAIIAVSILGHIILALCNFTYQDKSANLQDLFARHANIDHGILKAKKKWLGLLLILSPSQL